MPSKAGGNGAGPGEFRDWSADSAFADLAERIAPHLAPGAILTDVGSTKQSVVRDVGPLVPGGVHFIPAHPVAGTEHSGPDSGFTTLFRQVYGRSPAAYRSAA